MATIAFTSIVPQKRKFEEQMTRVIYTSTSSCTDLIPYDNVLVKRLKLAVRSIRWDKKTTGSESINEDDYSSHDMQAEVKIVTVPKSIIIQGLSLLKLDKYMLNENQKLLDSSFYDVSSEVVNHILTIALNIKRKSNQEESSSSVDKNCSMKDIEMKYREKLQDMAKSKENIEKSFLRLKSQQAHEHRVIRKQIRMLKASINQAANSLSLYLSEVCMEEK